MSELWWPLESEEMKGTNADGSISDDYCVSCFKNGEYTTETKDISMDEMIEINLQYIDEWNKSRGQILTVEEAREQLKTFMPNLKRWKCTCTEECASGHNPNCTCSNPECNCAE